MKHYEIHIRHNIFKPDIYYFMAKSNYKAIKQVVEYIKIYGQESDIIQIQLKERNNIICKFTPFIVQYSKEKKYAISF